MELELRRSGQNGKLNAEGAQHRAWLMSTSGLTREDSTFASSTSRQRTGTNPAQKTRSRVRQNRRREEKRLHDALLGRSMKPRIRPDSTIGGDSGSVVM